MKRRLAKKVLDEIMAAGFTLERAGRHCVFRRASDGARLIVATTPRSGTDHQLHWVRQDIRRLNKEHVA